jgi:hypothetical protein
LAVNAAEVAIPAAFVVAVFTPPANAAPAPLDGTVKVTVAPLIAAPLAFCTITTNGLANAVLTVALCPLPLTAAMEACPEAVLVSENEAVVDNPATDAITV